MTFSPEAVLIVIDALNAAGAPYLVTGSLATNLYTTPRSTEDADFVVEMHSSQLNELFQRLERDFVHEPQMAFETVTGKTQHIFQYRRTDFKIEIFEAQMSDPHEAARFARRLRGIVEGRQAYVPTAEDVIVQKLRWLKQIHRVKDREDVRMVILHRLRRLDWPYVQRWCEAHGTLDLLLQIKGEVEAKPLPDRI